MSFLTTQGDVLIAFGNEKLQLTHAGFEKIRRYFDGIKKGETLELTVYRDGKPVVLRTSKLN